MRLEHVKPRLLGHWGTTPGLNFLYAHLNRAVKAHDLNTIFVTGPGHGDRRSWRRVPRGDVLGGVPAHRPRRGRASKTFPPVPFPGGIPSHVAPETPGSIHEGGELGYALVHAYGAAFDNPDLLVCCVVGDGEAETGPLAASWHSNKFLNPERDGVVLPILHLNGYKIANPTVLARIPEHELRDLLRGYGHEPYFVDGDEPEEAHRRMAATLETVLAEIRAIRARRGRAAALADDRPAYAQGLDRTGRGHASVAPGAARARPAVPSSRPGCAATARRSSSTSTARSRRSSPRSRPKATDA